jgi:general secretion pathway protein A
LLQIVLFGQPELDKTLAKPGFRQLRQRINLRYHLLPLSEKETREYIEKRLRVAGARRPIFTEKAMKEIYQKSGGIPRLINILCDNTLLNGYALDQKIVDKRSVKEIAKDLNLGKKYHRIVFWTIFYFSVVTIILLLLYFQESNYLLLFVKEFLQAFY